MANLGKLELAIKNTLDQPAADPKTRIDVQRRDSSVILNFKNLNLPLPGVLEIPAFPQESNLRCSVLSKRYRPFSTGVFTLSTAEPKRLELQALRNPKEWSAQFVAWKQLSDEFKPLQKVLDASVIKVIKGEKLGTFTEDRYDAAKAEKSVLGKAALLNLFAKMTVLPEPKGGRTPWFSFVDRVLVIDQERFYALVDVEMGEIVRYIKDNPSDFKNYKSSTAGNHFDKLQETLPEFKIFKSKMFSIKTDDANGNLQLTMAPAKDAAGNDVLLLDADMDENGQLLNHLIDVFFIHPFNGGTHPFDIHEYLTLAHRHHPRGYELV
ncbi:MAG TPA: hypothetical protein PKA34_01825 [Blastocatellia bacterium]|nr:hypothetical protein [Blastocatellia bacterium]